MRGRVFRTVSELGIHYRHSPASSPGPRETPDAELIRHFTSDEAETPAYLRPRRPSTDGPVTLSATGTLILRFALPAGRPAPPFLVHLRRRGTRNGKPVIQSLDVAGHREIRFRSLDASLDFLTDFPVFDEAARPLRAAHAVRSRRRRTPVDPVPLGHEPQDITLRCTGELPLHPQSALHGLTNPQAPSLVAAIVVDGNPPTPSSWSRRRTTFPCAVQEPFSPAG
jgi:hypothetical protein